MCGVFAYTGSKHALPILVGGLGALEYRGYDSTGIFCPDMDHAHTAVGDTSALVKILPTKSVATAGIGHTRWATHGKPSTVNAHPHADASGKIWIVHNGIVDNYRELRDTLIARGHTFKSDTDSEVIAHYIGIAREHSDTLTEAVASALQHVEGTYGIAVLDKTDPDTIVAASFGSPLIVGVGGDAYFIASDIAPLLRHTKDVVYMRDGDITTITPDGYTITSHTHDAVQRVPETVTMNATDVERGEYPHFMYKEIVESASVVSETLRGRIDITNGTAKLGGLETITDTIAHARSVCFVGCGSAYFAGRSGVSAIEKIAGIPAHAVVASEFYEHAAACNPDTIVIAISQSGETADTIAAVREAKRHGLCTLGIVNVVGSTLAREVDAGVYTHAGAEVSVASTKAFCAQLTVVHLIALFLGRLQRVSLTHGVSIANALMDIPKVLEQTRIDTHENIKRCAQTLTDVYDTFFLGRGNLFPIALEGALKLKEVSYIHAEGYAAGELKHGPLALITNGTPVVAFTPADEATYEKMCGAIEEVKARGAYVIAFASAGDTRMATLADHVISVPNVPHTILPFVMTVPVHLLAYETGIARGVNVDRPRNLAKSVTVG